MPTKGESIYSKLLLQLVRESVPGVYDPNGQKTVMTQVKGDFVPEEEWANFRPDGFTVDAWNALSKEHRAFNGTFQPDFSHMDVLLEMAAGVSKLVTTAPTSDTTQNVYEFPAMGERGINTYTIERGTPDNCERCTYGVLVALSNTNDRDTAAPEGSLTILCRKPTPDAIGVPMSGGVAQNAVLRFSATGVATDGVFALKIGSAAPVNFTATIGDTTAQTAAKLLALGITATVVGTVATGAGETHRVYGPAVLGNATFYGGAVTLNPNTSTQATLEAAIQALGGSFASRTVTATIIPPVTNAAKGTATATPASATAANAIDGDPNTVATLGNVADGSPSGFTLTIDRGASAPNVPISNAVISTAYGGFDSGPDSYVETSTDNATWTRIVDAIQIPGGATGTFPASSGAVVKRYVRLVATHNQGAFSQWQIKEFALTPTNPTPGFVDVLITVPSAAGNVADIDVVGDGYTGTSTQPGAAGGTILATVTSPANTPISVTPVSGAGWSGVQQQVGSDGKFRIPKRIPLMPQMFSYRQSDTRAGLDTAPPVGRVKKMGWNVESLVSLEWFFDENNLSPQSHSDNADVKRSLTVMMAKSSSSLAQIQSDATAQPSTPRWREIRAAHPDTKHLFRFIMFGSVMAAAPIQAAGNIQGFEFPIGETLTDTPGSDSSCALVLRKLA